jgi:hypothetical protein
VAGSRALAAEGDTVLSPAKRQDALDKARKLLATRDVAPVTVDPFHSEKFSEMVSGLGRTSGVTAPVTASPRTEREILQAIATSLKPSGNFILGGQSTLVFGQKRVKAGGFLTITFEGTEYTLEITAIERTSFTLRLNREEFTRPIK